jgi:alpha-L-fucosidase
VPQQETVVRATSEAPAFHLGDVFPAHYVADGRPESYWSTRAADRKLPHSITLDLGRVRPVAALTYQPPSQNSAKGIITAYKVSLSLDGSSFTPVSDGTWPVSTATKIANWPAQDARFVRFEALSAQQGVAAAGEINVSERPIVQ